MVNVTWSLSFEPRSEGPLETLLEALGSSGLFGHFRLLKIEIAAWLLSSEPLSYPSACVRVIGQSQHRWHDGHGANSDLGNNDDKNQPAGWSPDEAVSHPHGTHFISCVQNHVFPLVGTLK